MPNLKLRLQYVNTSTHNISPFMPYLLPSFCTHLSKDNYIHFPYHLRLEEYTNYYSRRRSNLPNVNVLVCYYFFNSSGYFLSLSCTKVSTPSFRGTIRIHHIMLKFLSPGYPLQHIVFFIDLVLVFTVVSPPPLHTPTFSTFFICSMVQVKLYILNILLHTKNWTNNMLF